MKYVKNKCKSFIPYFHQSGWHFEEINKNKYLMLVPTNESKEIIKNVKNCGVKSEI